MNNSRKKWDYSPSGLALNPPTVFLIIFNRGPAVHDQINVQTTYSVLQGTNIYVFCSIRQEEPDDPYWLTFYWIANSLLVSKLFFLQMTSTAFSRVLYKFLQVPIQ